MPLTITKHDNAHWVFSGSFDSDNISKHYRDLSTGRPRSGDWLLDFQSLEHMDSAGLAFLLNAIRYCTSRNISLSFLSMPGSVISLMKLQGVFDIISEYVKGEENEHE